MEGVGEGAGKAGKARCTLTEPTPAEVPTDGLDPAATAAETPTLILSDATFLSTTLALDCRRRPPSPHGPGVCPAGPWLFVFLGFHPRTYLFANLVEAVVFPLSPAHPAHSRLKLAACSL